MRHTVMKLKPHHISGKQMAVFIWDHSDQCGGSVVHFGTARFSADELYVERDEEPCRIPIPKEAWMTL